MEDFRPDGGKRLLGCVANEPAVTDRLVQQAIAQVLTPIFDPTFSDLSSASARAVMHIKPSGRCGKFGRCRQL